MSIGTVMDLFHLKQPSWQLRIFTPCVLQYRAISILGMPYFSDMAKAWGHFISFPMPSFSNADRIFCSSIVTLFSYQMKGDNHIYLAHHLARGHPGSTGNR